MASDPYKSLYSRVFPPSVPAQQAHPEITGAKLFYNINITDWGAGQSLVWTDSDGLQTQPQRLTAKTEIIAEQVQLHWLC